MTHPFSQAEFDAIYSCVPRLCVEIVMVEPGGVVLTRRSIPPGEGLWHLPGATVRFGETLAQTARRVALDETGVEIECLEQLGVVEYVFPNYAHRPVAVVYLAQPIGRRYRCDETATDVRAFQVPDQLIEIDVIVQHRAFLLEHAEVINRRVRAVKALE
jgi:ADP-ribose pyrophosphatase YjhB (NUDIX family)